MAVAGKTYHFTAPLWLYEGPAAWHFITLPTEVAQDIEERFGHLKRGWGSLPVQLTIAATSWTTSIFTDKRRESFLLPIKAKARQAAHLEAGDTVSVTLTVKP